MNYFTKNTIVFTLISLTTFAQDAKKEVQKIETKMDLFSSKTGTIIKFIDTKLSPMKTSYSNLETRIRKVVGNEESHYFYQIEKQAQYSNPTALIEYSDLLEIIKAFNVLKAEIDKDMKSNPDYLENKFTTEDGFQLGYYVSNGKLVWYIRLEKYGSDNTVFIKDVQTLETSLLEAKNKIEELKK